MCFSDPEEIQEEIDRLLKTAAFTKDPDFIGEIEQDYTFCQYFPNSGCCG